MFERSQNWNAKTEIFHTLEGRTEFQNARTLHRHITFSSTLDGNITEDEPARLG